MGGRSDQSQFYLDSSNRRGLMGGHYASTEIPCPTNAEESGYCKSIG
jgi:hypothetical protein